MTSWLWAQKCFLVTNSQWMSSSTDVCCANKRGQYGWQLRQTFPPKFFERTPIFHIFFQAIYFLPPPFFHGWTQLHTFIEVETLSTLVDIICSTLNKSASVYLCSNLSTDSHWWGLHECWHDLHSCHLQNKTSNLTEHVDLEVDVWAVDVFLRQ